MRFLINRTDALGDTLLTLPLLDTIKEYFPNCFISFLVKKNSEDLLKFNPSVDDIQTMPSGFLPTKLRELGKIFKDGKFDYYIYVGGSHLPSLVAFLKGVSHRMGLVSRWPSFIFLNRGKRQQRSCGSTHEITYNIDLVKDFILSKKGIVDRLKFESKNTPKIFLSKGEIYWGRCWLQYLKRKKNCETKEVSFIMVHAGMTGHTLNWPSKKYLECCLNLYHKSSNHLLFIFSYTPSDHPYIETIKEELKHPNYLEHFKKQIFFLDGSTIGLRRFLSILKGCHSFLGPSTGPLHMACALDVPCVGIYSPLVAQKSVRWAPRVDKAVDLKILTPDVGCIQKNRCLLNKCPEYFCMDKISVDSVVLFLLEVMAHSSGPNTNVLQGEYCEQHI